MKPKRNYNNGALDLCQTPPEALIPLLPYLKKFNLIWEPAAGEGIIQDTLTNNGIACIGSDILTGLDFLENEIVADWDCIVTNPPYSIKYKWVHKCLTYGKPFALLMPVETLGAKSFQSEFKNKELELILFDKRINFKMPTKGWDSAAQFPTAWFTHKLGIEKPFTYWSVLSEN